MGALAAAAAHELGTPLGTITMVAHELKREISPDDPVAEDVALLADQAARCRQILADLAARPDAEGGAPYEQLSVTALVEAAGEPHARPEIHFAVTGVPGDASDRPVAKRSPELVHGLGNLLQNAFQFARRRVTVRAEWSRHTVTVTINDDGPGYPPAVLGRLGEPYVSGRSRPGANMGLGIFIARTLLQRTGARLRFSNRSGGGAQVTVRWPRSHFEARRS